MTVCHSNSSVYIVPHLYSAHHQHVRKKIAPENKSMRDKRRLKPRKKQPAPCPRSESLPHPALPCAALTGSGLISVQKHYYNLLRDVHILSILKCKIGKKQHFLGDFFSFVHFSSEQSNRKKRMLASNSLNVSFLLFLQSGLKGYKGHHIALNSEESQSSSFTRWQHEKHHPRQPDTPPFPPLPHSHRLAQEHDLVRMGR